MYLTSCKAGHTIPTDDETEPQCPYCAIDTLRKENERLREALKRIASTFNSNPCCYPYHRFEDDTQHSLACHRGIAKQALNK